MNEENGNKRTYIQEKHTVFIEMNKNSHQYKKTLGLSLKQRLFLNKCRQLKEKGKWQVSNLQLLDLDYASQ